MQFLIDGYNLLFLLGLATRQSRPAEFDRARVRLIEWIRQAHHDRSDVVDVVLDGPRRGKRSEQVDHLHGLIIRTALGQSADDLIEQLIAKMAAPKKWVVVSSDRRLRDAATHRGCESWDVNRYIDWVLDRRRPEVLVEPAAAKPETLTAEEVEQWLREFGFPGTGSGNQNS